jgi:hypothetical protein
MRKKLPVYVCTSLPLIQRPIPCLRPKKKIRIRVIGLSWLQVFKRCRQELFLLAGIQPPNPRRQELFLLAGIQPPNPRRQELFLLAGIQPPNLRRQELFLLAGIHPPKRRRQELFLLAGRHPPHPRRQNLFLLARRQRKQQSMRRIKVGHRKCDGWLGADCLINQSESGRCGWFCRRSVALVSQNFRLGDLFELVVQSGLKDADVHDSFA